MSSVLHLLHDIRILVSWPSFFFGAITFALVAILLGYIVENVSRVLDFLKHFFATDSPTTPGRHRSYTSDSKRDHTPDKEDRP